MIKKLLMLVVCVAVVAALVPSYVGAASPSAGAGLAQEQQYNQAINKLERFLSISETGNIVLNAPKRIVNSIDSKVYQSLLAGIEQTNSMIDSGYLVCNPDFTLTVTEKYLESCGQYLEPNSQLVAEGNAVTLLSSSGGVTKVVWHWWGFEFYLSSSYVKWIAAGLYVGSIVAAFVPEPFASKVAAVLIGGLGVLLTSLDNGNGVIIQFIWPAIPVSVRPQ
jgi:hypothetical protein